MSFTSYPSKLLDKAVNEFSKLPGIGNKTALRLVLHLLKQNEAEVDTFGSAIIDLRRNIKHCNVCHNISDTEVCSICADNSRDKSTVCVVESIRDVLAIENTEQYNGLYHVLGGIISPMDGVGPSDLTINHLVERVGINDVKEVILALSTTMEGDTTNFFIYRKLSGKPIQITTLARGVAVGDELSYTDEITLGRSLANRTAFST